MIEQPVETWIDARWRGHDGPRRAVVARGATRTRWTGPRSCARAPRRSRSATVRWPTCRSRNSRPIPCGSPPCWTRPRVTAAGLPEVAGSSRWPGSGRRRAFHRGAQAFTLLTVSNATPALRAALFGVLARMPDVDATGERTDELGRRGEGLEVRFPTGALGPLAADPSGRPLGGENATRPDIIRVVFDPKTSDILSWSVSKDLQLRPPASPEGPQRLGEAHLSCAPATCSRPATGPETARAALTRGSQHIGAPGFEPGTSPTRTVRATRLRHAPSGTQSSRRCR